MEKEDVERINEILEKIENNKECLFEIDDTINDINYMQLMWMGKGVLFSVNCVVLNLRNLKEPIEDHTNDLRVELAKLRGE